MTKLGRSAALLSPVVLTAILTQDGVQQDAQPPNPFTLGEEQRERGNPLAAYVELHSLEHIYQQADQTRLFYDAKATLQSILGDTQGAIRSWAQLTRPRRSRGPLLNSPLDGYVPTDAIDFILAQSTHHNVVMLGEEHVQPQTRSILKPLIQQLWSRGFRYFAAETFVDDLAETVAKGYTLLDSGYYTQEPVFAEAVTEAIRLGYKLISYENRESVTAPPDDPMFRQNHREGAQARNLKERIIDVDPDAKVIVWAGRAHVAETAGEVPGAGTLKPMAYQFREMTGIDPFTVYLPAGVEQASPEYEFSFYRYATHHGWVEAPTILVDEKGASFGVSGDALVFFPRVQLEFGRPDWLSRDLGRHRVQIPRDVLFEDGLQLVQAFHVEEFDRAVPIDQILINPGDPVPVLMLPPDRTYHIRSISDSGAIRGPQRLTVPSAGS